MPSRFTELGLRKGKRLGRNVKRQRVLRSAQCYESIPSLPASNVIYPVSQYLKSSVLPF